LKSSLQFLKKLKIELPYDPGISSLGRDEMKIYKYFMYVQMFTEELFTINDEEVNKI
jgi:hypothetical protein